MGTNGSTELLSISSAAGDIHQGVDLLGLVHEPVIHQLLTMRERATRMYLRRVHSEVHVPEDGGLIADERNAAGVSDPELEMGDAVFNLSATGTRFADLLGEANTFAVALFSLGAELGAAGGPRPERVAVVVLMRR